jgi:Skp family chaperone for outer membrane proteins
MKRSMPTWVSLSADAADVFSYRTRQLGTIQADTEAIARKLVRMTLLRLMPQRTAGAGTLQLEQRAHTSEVEQIAAASTLDAELGRLIPLLCAQTKEVAS